MRDVLRPFVVIPITLFLVVGCVEYGGNQETEPECYTKADCNPQKECGEMVKCIDGKCDPDQTENLPCQQTCTTDQDCPAGMHCRVDVCVVDGSCADVSECVGLPHDDCVGSFACKNGLCKYECQDITSCSQNTDCVLADRGCCCGFDPEDYVAVRQDKLTEWRSREECQRVDCPAVACQIPDSIEAVCFEGECAVHPKNVDWYACETDSDCVKVTADCCECQYGVPDIGINKNFEDEYMSELLDFCIRADVWCPGYSACTDHGAVCHQGRCTTVHEQCGCEETWDPVCMGANAAGVWATLRNECVADCLELEWDYHGRCDCLGDCGLGMQVCASNGQSYWCGQWEAECNGQTVAYPGECSPECDDCNKLGRPWVPVCTEDFRTYPDGCFAECQSLDWWHQGECLTGEGQICNIEGSYCFSEELFCQTYGCFSCTGTCIALGSCLEPDDCIGQPLAVDDCVGHWTCPNHECTWVCD